MLGAVAHQRATARSRKTPWSNSPRRVLRYGPTVRLACTFTLCCTRAAAPLFWASTAIPAAPTAVPFIWLDMSKLPASAYEVPPAPPAPPAAPMPLPPVPAPPAPPVPALPAVLPLAPLLPAVPVGAPLSAVAAPPVPARAIQLWAPRLAVPVLPPPRPLLERSLLLAPPWPLLLPPYPPLPAPAPPLLAQLLPPAPL